MADWENKPEEKQQEFKVTFSREEMALIVKVIGGQSQVSWQRHGLSLEAAQGFGNLYDQINVELEDDLVKLSEISLKEA